VTPDFELCPVLKDTVRQETEMKKDELDFDSVYDEFHARISQYLERMVGKGGAEDLTQEVFMKVNKGRGLRRKK
jgi:DNA-directed RNA polymerase specialized sigma24 family protein